MSKPEKKQKRPQMKIYFSTPEAKAIQGAINLLSEANGEAIKPQDYGKLAILHFTDHVGIKYADMKAKEEESNKVDRSALETEND